DWSSDGALPIWPRCAPRLDAPFLEMNGEHRGSVYAPYRYNEKSMQAELACFEPSCRARFAITDVIYNCPRCGGLLETIYPGLELDPAAVKSIWRERRTCNLPLDQ